MRGDIGPADLVGLGDPAPRDAVDLTGLQRDLHVLPRHRHRHHAELRQEAPGGGEGEDPLALHVRQRGDRRGGDEMARVPRTRRDVLDPDAGVFLGPDLVQAPVVEQRRHVERIAAGEGEIAAEHRDLGGRSHAVVVGLHRVDCAALHRLEQLARRHQLVGVEQVDLHLVAGDGVEPLDGRQRHLRAERGPGIGLQPPADRRLRMNRRRGKGRRTAKGAGGQELPSCRCQVMSPGWGCGERARRPRLLGSGEIRPGSHSAIWGEDHDQRRGQGHHPHEGDDGPVDVDERNLFAPWRA